MTITVYRSDDASAPTLTGQIGSLTTLLDAILINGYGAKAAAGWAIAFTGTNQRAYRAAAGNRFYLQVDDNNTLSAGAQYARTVAYESMSAITTGTAPVPTSGQVSGGMFLQKSTTADSTTRAWWCIASGSFFYFMACAATTAATGPTNASLNYTDSMLAFGDFTSKKSGDTFNTLHMANPTVGNNNTVAGFCVAASTWIATPGHYLVRPYTQLSSSAPMAKAPTRRSMTNGASILGNDTAAPNFPDPVTGGMLLGEVLVVESGGGGTIGLTRGLWPGLYDLIHNPASLASAFNPLDTVAGAGVYAGITFTLVKLSYGSSNAQGYAAIQTSGTWP